MQISDEMVEKALEAYHATDDFLVDKIRDALTAALSVMSKRDYRAMVEAAALPQLPRHKEG